MGILQVQGVVHEGEVVARGPLQVPLTGGAVGVVGGGVTWTLDGAALSDVGAPTGGWRGRKGQLEGNIPTVVAPRERP